MAKTGGIGKRLSTYCLIDDMIYLKREEVLPVVGITICRFTSYSPPQEFYEVAYRGLVFYVSDAIKIDPKESQRLKDMSPEDQARYKDAALAYTKVNWLDLVKSAFLELDKTKSQDLR